MPNFPDITQQDNDELHRFFEFSLDMLCIATSGGYFKRINAAWEKTLGHSKAELMEVPYISFVHPDDRDRTVEEAQALTHGQDTIWFENRYRCKDGTYKWLLWRATAVRDRNVIYAAARDITEHKEAEVELRRTAEELKRSNQELEQFAYVASHDLQEPLRMVSSYLQLLERRYKGALDANADTFIGYAVDGAQRMQALIHDLLAYSRLGSARKEFVETDFAKVIRDVLASLKVAIEESHAAVTHEAMPVLMADPVQMGQLFQNLIANAIKFRSPEPPKIHLSVRKEAAHWTFSVQDNGIGIEPQFFGRIFTIFQRLHAQGEFPGTGIGLAVCKKIVERHGGRIWLESERGRGTVFHFSIPAHARSAPK